MTNQFYLIYGCDPGLSSYDGAHNGALTTALLQVCHAVTLDSPANTLWLSMPNMLPQ